MVAMSVMPVAAAGESLTDVVAELGVSNMYKLQDIFENYFTDTKLDELNTYLGTNYSDLRADLASDNLDVDVLKDLADDIAGVSLTEAMANGDAASAIFAQKAAVITTLGDIVDRTVTARGGSTNTEYAYDMIVNHLLNKNTVVTYNTSTGVYDLNFSAYKTDAALISEMEIIMPTSFAAGKYESTIDDLEAYFEHILNSGDFDTHEVDFRAAIDSWNTGDFYYAYTPSTGGGGGGGTTTTEETPDVVTGEDEGGETTATSTIESGATVTTGNDGTKKATIDNTKVKAAVDAVVAKGATSAKVVIEIPDTGADVAVGLEAGTVNSLKAGNVDLSIKTEKVEYDIKPGAIDTGDMDDGDELRFNSKEQDPEEFLGNADLTSNEGIALAAAVKGKSKLVEISLDRYSADGQKAGEVHSFDKAIKIRVSLEDIPDADSDKIGVYYIDEESGKPVFMGGKVVTDANGNKFIEFETNHLSKYAVLEATVSYPDLADHWSKKYVESMGAKHVVNGYPDGSFLPEKAVTRVEFAKMLVEAMGYEMVDYEGSFPDVAEGEWFADYVATAEANGVVLGYTDGTFKPNLKINRLVMATMLTRAYNAKLEGQEADILSEFADKATIADWGTEYAAKAVEEGFMNGMDGTFNPDGTTTRAQAATAVYRLFNK